MYQFLLYTHSWVRWIVLALGLIVIVKSYSGWFSKKGYGKADNALAAAWVGFVLLNAVVGIVLYFGYSPLTKTALADFGAAMKNANLRFWAVEHSTIMILASIMAQVARIRIKKVRSDVKKFKLSAILYTVALVFILAGIPWDQAVRLFRF
ncbi:hypothetical protein FUAX_46750 (plasmid) [Fulvitalea axinellae]|uniref:DUF420 domain-containing protein n=1 Tax=Fulvitalea axinellae TaxID=1182444 RepID=A0AAU9CW63_9BACT|nr:hypothetical protein FUAX_46750 [Fulvitalea axinellae]